MDITAVESLPQIILHSELVVLTVLMVLERLIDGLGESLSYMLFD